MLNDALVKKDKNAVGMYVLIFPQLYSIELCCEELVIGAVIRHIKAIYKPSSQILDDIFAR